ncbi:MAG: amidoligase family protein [Oscillospiraceae bacterium]|nr:amidoligase family protein [Oscillospiraceae bacterium]
MSDTFICSHCGYTCSLDDMETFDGEEICQECYDDETVICSHCGDRIWADDVAGDSNHILCDRCYTRYYTDCEDCGRTIHAEDAYYLDDEPDNPYCHNCYCRHDSGEYIHDYSFKPDPIFYGSSSRYFGVELEIDGGGQYASNAEKIIDIANADSTRRIYIKRDSSLNDGMEIVTHPMSLDYHLNKMPWADVMRKAASLGYRSHKTKTCGLHIHVNRSSFGDTHEEQEACISRVLFFVERFWQELLKFSRRTESQLSRWAARYGIKENPKATFDNAKKNYSGRYTCVNLTNSQTIEFRIFRGTLKYNTFVAALQLVNRICDISARMTDEEMTLMNWCDFVSGVEEPELITYLKERRLYVNEPVECEEEY